MGWISDFLSGGLHQVAVGQAKDDLQDFLSRLSILDDEAIGMAVASATILRLQLHQSGDLPKAALEVLVYDNNNLSHPSIGIFQVTLNATIQRLQREGSVYAGGGFVWLHTLRTLSYPSLQPLGVEMWNELKRGFKYADDEKIKLFFSAAPENISQEFTYIPAIYR